ncbi:hypothetical protein D5086_021820, partial [Populus alba]
QDEEEFAASLVLEGCYMDHIEYVALQGAQQCPEHTRGGRHHEGSSPYRSCGF